MKKTIAILIVFILAVIALTIPVQAATATANLNPSKSTVKPGETFTVALSVTCQDGINGVTGITFNYDTSKLELVSERAGTNFTNLGSGNVIDLISNATDKVTTADVYILELKAKSNITTETTANVSVGAMTVDSDAATDSEASVGAKSTTITIKPEAKKDENNTNTSGNTNGGSNNSSNTNTNTSGTTNGGSNNSSSTNTNSNKSTNSKTANTSNRESKLPYTGTTSIVFGAILVLAGVAGITFVAYRRYKKI